MTELFRETLFDQATDHNARLAALDFDLLRHEMLTLFEAAAHAVQVAGYEQDDAVIDRFVVCRIKSDVMHVLADHFSTVALFKTSIKHQLAQKLDEKFDDADIEIVSVRVVATLERWPD